ncbi:uncharacterized protein LOC106166258 [Lingula anatina]|uniref:Uncharacterized protein LOC106166258 n=1 Tax=Lingula anatina TaxID=7574 RepID=A0A1S3IQ57_LINAN|nr:uncharacterized protein LOC106166258 [Lingula anatina]|eukprot:XP_013400203.1 uncharacterized protein LOC106166258 [Lingula anatina]
MTPRILLGCLLVVLLLPASIDAWCLSGVVSSDYCKRGSSERCQSQVKYVRFNQRFRKTPVVMTAISAFDIWRRANSRLTVYPSSISTHGFNMNMKTWGNTHLYRVSVSWIACL